MMRRIACCILIYLLFLSNNIYSQENGSQLMPSSDSISTTYNDNTEVEFRKNFGEIVLLKNQGGILPLHADQLNSIALIGPTIFYPGIGDMENSKVKPHSYISPYEGMVRQVGDSIILYTAMGANMKSDVIRLDSSYVYIGQGVNGFSAKYYNGKEPAGKPEKFITDKFIDFFWRQPPHPGLEEKFSVSWDATLIPEHGPVKVKLVHSDGCRLSLDGKLIIDAWDPGPVRIDSAWLNIKKGQSYNLRIDYFSDGGPALIKLGFDYLKSNMINEAVDKARRADVAIVFVGQTASRKDEADVKGYYNIPNQSRLIRAVIEANPNTIVVMQAGFAVDIEKWAFDVPAIIQAWNPEQESGTRIAEVLFGQINPSGKISFKWVMNENQNYSTRYPFGYGLSYTTFGIGKLMMMRNRDGSGWTANIEIKNLDSRAGTEVLQVYVHDLEGRKEKTYMELKAFKRITLLPGQKKTVSIPLPYEAFAYYNVEKAAWTIEPGRYEIHVGTSAEDIKLRKTIEIRDIHLNK